MAKKELRTGRGGAAPGAPRPKIEPRREPLRSHKGFRLGVAAVVVLAVLWGATAAWGQISRSRTLRRYDKALTLAMRAFEKHNTNGGATTVPEKLQGFSQGTVGAAEMDTLAAQWESDFTTARDAISKLDPPRELKTTQDIYVQTMDGYIGLARLAAVGADIRRDLDRASASAKPALGRALGGITKQLEDERQRLDKLRGIAQTRLVALKVDWGVNDG